jgi:hypothetical protein
MTLLLITLFNAQADDTTTYAPVTTIDFEDVDVSANTTKPQIVFIQETKRPDFQPGDLIEMFIVEPTRRPLSIPNPEETLTITEEK